MNTPRPIHFPTSVVFTRFAPLCRFVGSLCVAALLFSAGGCRSVITGGSSSETAVLVLFRADSNVRNPALNDAYPGVRRIALRALDGATRPDDVLQLADRVTLAPGERVLLFAAESSTGVVTLSELTVTARAGEELAVLPVRGEGGAILVELRRGFYGEVAGRSSPWKAPETRR